jgi:tryptophan synthase alpha chain|tara:strand:- start:135 stop:947 length:813 start_codon:yes stop_codon:yes gene_type:complete
MNRISELFHRLKADNKSALGIFITAGDPDIELSQRILNSLPDNGADFIELGMPFSDPMADGPSIQASSLRALKKGMNLSKTLLMVKKFREKNTQTPIILMGYFNPIFRFGVEKFINQAEEVGVDGFIIVDLPPEEDGEFFIPLKKSKMHLIRLITPTTDNNRLQIVLKNTSGFLYYVSITGITGTKQASNRNIKDAVSRINNYSDLPVAVGFGIKSQEQVSEISEYTNAVVIGSHIVKIIENAYIKKHINRDKIVEDINIEVKNLSLGIK